MTTRPLTRLEFAAVFTLSFCGGFLTVLLIAQKVSG